LKKTIIIRADGGVNLGMGHIVRSLALADMLKDEFSVVFAIQEPDNNTLKAVHQIVETVIHLPKTDDFQADCKNFSDYLRNDQIVVLDGYNFQTDYQRSLKKKGCKLIVIDDLILWHHVADGIINHADQIDPRIYSKEDDTKLYLGLDYALLRKPFLSREGKARQISFVKKVFISMGAADINNITSKFCSALIEIAGIEEIHLMLGSINPHLKELNELAISSPDVKIISHFNINAAELSALLKKCELCICPASSISMESCAVGIPLLSGYTAENQMNILHGLLKHEAAISLGNFNTIKKEEIIDCIHQLRADSEKLDTMVKNQSKMIDGRSPERLLTIFKDLQ
jgi:UDP-2,4-diacetamido-2,4,6-trideoxy-beta-L-altropyranose hydrolase